LRKASQSDAADRVCGLAACSRRDRASGMTQLVDRIGFLGDVVDDPVGPRYGGVIGQLRQRLDGVLQRHQAGPLVPAAVDHQGQARECLGEITVDHGAEALVVVQSREELFVVRDLFAPGAEDRRLHDVGYSQPPGAAGDRDVHSGLGVLTERAQLDDVAVRHVAADRPQQPHVAVFVVAQREQRLIAAPHGIRRRPLLGEVIDDVRSPPADQRIQLRRRCVELHELQVGQSVDPPRRLEPPRRVGQREQAAAPLALHQPTAQQVVCQHDPPFRMETRQPKREWRAQVPVSAENQQGWMFHWMHIVSSASRAFRGGSDAARMLSIAACRVLPIRVQQIACQENPERKNRKLRRSSRTRETAPGVALEQQVYGRYI